VIRVREAERGETEGRKPRPVAVGVRIAKPKGEDLLVLFPITSQPPAYDRFAVAIPEMEKRRAGLDASLRLWIVLDEAAYPAPSGVRTARATVRCCPPRSRNRQWRCRPAAGGQ
jgi:hypothetical protein